MKMVRHILGIAVAGALSMSAYAATAQTTQSNPASVVQATQTAPVTVTTSASVAEAQNSAAQVALQQQIQQLQNEINQLQNSVTTAATGTTHKPTGIHVLLDATDNVLFETFPSANNFSLAALQAKNQFQTGDLVFGGYLEQDTQYWNGNQLPASTGNYQKGSQVALTSAKVDAMANLNNWTTSFISLAAGNLSATNSSTTNNMQLAKAFLIFGNLNKSPLYGVVGKTYLPFGSFGGGGPWSAPLDRLYFRPAETTQADMSYFKNGLSTNLALFNNNSSANANNYSNDFVYSLSYSQTQGEWTYNMGAGYLNDLRGTSAGIASSATGTRNYAVDINAGIGYGLYALSSEYVQGSSAVGVNSGKPAAWNVTGTYSPTLAGKLTLFSLSRDMTTQLSGVSAGLAGNAVPGSNATSGLRSQWVAAADREFFPNVFIGLELETAKTYSAQNTYTGTIDVSAYF